MKRLFDLLLAIALIPIVLVPCLVIVIVIRGTSAGPALYWSQRVGRSNRLFEMAKFRTMRSGTPALATHLLSNPAAYITPVGAFLRRSSLDELPQLWNVLRGDMSFVGPRPALFNQNDLIEMRRRRGIDRLRPGITGLAQIGGRDELPLEEKVALDADYLKRQSLLLDLRIIFLTGLRVLRREGIAH
jgi:O-antigen biosynthesis protein WbqP